MLPEKRSKAWRIYFVLLALANIITIVFPLLLLAWLRNRARGGVSGTEYVAFALLPLLLAGTFVAILNLVSIVVYFVKHKPRGRLMAIGIIVSFLSVVYLGTVGILAYRSYFELQDLRETGGQKATITKQSAIMDINSCRLIELKQQKSAPPRLVIKANDKIPPLGDVKYAENKDWDDLKAEVEKAPASCHYDGTTVLQEGVVRPLLPISVEKATTLINSCRNEGIGLDFYYDYIYVSEETFGNKISKDMIEKSSTGVLLAFSTIYGTPESIHVAVRNVEKLLPIAREAQKNCRYNFLIHYGDASHGNDKIESLPSN